MQGHRVLLLGATGRTGRHVLEQLLDRGAHVVAIVRSRARLPDHLASSPGLTIVEADLLSLSDEDLRSYVRDCDTVISCLGHTLSLKGIYGRPRDLVTQAVSRACAAARDPGADRTVRFILMSSVSVNHPEVREPRRGAFEKVAVWAIRGVLPPARDNQRAAEHLYYDVGTLDPRVQWVVVRPDTLLEGEVSAYTLHEQLVNSLRKPGSTRMANVAAFMCDLATTDGIWSEWSGRLPVIVDAPATARG